MDGSRSIPRAAIDAQVLDQVLTDITSPAFAPALVHATRAALVSDTDPATQRQLAAEISAIGLERDRDGKQRELQRLEAEAERAGWVGGEGGRGRRGAPAGRDLGRGERSGP